MPGSVPPPDARGGLDGVRGVLGATWMVGAAGAVVLRPWLWSTAVRQLVRLAPDGWWRRRPHLPVPDPDYLRFRLVTAYGGAGGAPRPGDVVTYLHWCRAWPRVTGS